VLNRTSRIRPGLALWIVVGAVVAVVVPLGLSDVWMTIFDLALISALAAVALDLLLGHAGLVSIGNAAFMAIGAVAAAEVGVFAHVPFPIPLLIGGVAGSVAGALVAIPSLRMAGLYVAIGTLALHFVAVWALRAVQIRQVGDVGYVMPVAGIGDAMMTMRSWYWLLLALVVVEVIGVQLLMRRAPGRAWHAIREAPALASMSGISVWRYKVWAFVVSSFLVGLAGGCYAYFIGNVGVDNFGLELAVQFIAMVVLGGLGSTYGAIAGAFFFGCLPQILVQLRDLFGLGAETLSGGTIALINGAVAGAVVVIVIMLEPRGLAALLNRGRVAGGSMLTALRQRRAAAAEGQPGA
jgi:branched-chain amino acid transport system permease protein